MGRRIHPAVHYEEDLLTLGIVEHGSRGLVYKVVTSARRQYPADKLGPILTRPPMAYKALVGRWPAQARAAWLAGETPPASFAEATGGALALFTRLLDVSHETAVVLAVWTVATYFHRLFPAFPRLFLTGEAASGKSKAQQIIAGLAWNGLYRIVPTGPVLFRLIEAVRPTYCVSEAERLGGEQRQVLEAVINEGYTRGGMVDRCEGESREPRTFAVYAPLTLGSIKALKAVTETRAISLVMTRGTDRGKLNAEADPDGPPFVAVRDLVHRLALERFRDVAVTVQDLGDPPWLVARERQLWRPLLVIAHLADREAEGALSLEETIQEAARAQTEERGHPSEEAAALAVVLERQLKGADEILVRPRDLVNDLKAHLHWEYLR
ncbi:MAG: hypothetical protein ACREMG_00230, partial [Gemmatimonadales bacterium]